MYFNSFAFCFFLITVFILHWFVFNKSKTNQNLLLILVSYFFYSFWNWHFLFLLVFSTLLDFYSAIQIENASNVKIKKFWFWSSIGINLGFLGVFKYYNFFVASFTEMLLHFGFKCNPLLLDIMLPVGISFYTFHGLSYVIDIYKGRIKAEKNFIDYSIFVCYFPLLVAGPIERATHLLPQVKFKREFDYQLAKEGVYQIVWGFVKKVVIADSCATYANAIFDHYEQMNSLSLILGAVYFSFQIYGDFSGYSDIALGVSKLFGIRLLKNFDFPYFSRDIAEFWRRWHMSLSSWFRDYLYIPLGGSVGGKWMQIKNTFIIFLVSGFWHGANWTFIFWGGLNALYFLPLLLLQKNRKNIGEITITNFQNGFHTISNIFITFILTSFAWIFFRAQSLHQAFGYIERMFTNHHFSIQFLKNQRQNHEILILIIAFIMVEWFNKYKIEPISGKYEQLKLVLFLVAIIMFGVFTDYKNFIYFQF
ncbi:membrane-bound O-acyltransferase family protein [Flavobacterium branchiophilum NBRC 15030 = ATCC 35035]|uniref:D-alanyl-lipoteichoic acid acyltransferase DltB (MBOAT superfamily) n=1 Tax=Flavobacterium branchiophilum TaxID=55197 RepID=A0A543G8P0_9FLAO|nr:MBOAT family O-acyltransferase [Flavobacterium branchiophilum]OXA76771.1 membrane-bound O-acyltransferase family protein [Flavobacterium branchiophilum NBRC 15030 = ATCC 35035]TQM42456.1 D-alanyl-lipoteichoic acid acyltransferase DltB (MBOAT superfamily) [Flavobacterium branchiophilum]GEM54152.1 O-acyltransferase [Flavobacterium branchiophilum NBRC 15030 = ATCC 35035]